MILFLCLKRNFKQTKITMRIFAYYLEDLDIDTGTPIRARNVIKFLTKENEVFLVAPKLSSEALLSKVKFYPIKKYSFLKGLNFFFKVRDLKKLIKEIKPDILYGFDCNSIFALGIIAKSLKIPTVLEMHGEGHKISNQNIFWRSLLGYLEKMLIKYINGIVTVSSQVRDYYVNLEGNPDLLTKVIYDGVDIDIFNPDAPMAKEMQELKEKGKIIIGYSGNFKSYQGVDFLLRAAIESPDDFIYTLVGKGEGGIKEKIAKYGLQNKVFLLGRKPHNEVPNYLSGMDIVVVPRPSNSITEHALPLKIFEYMAMAKAVVSTDVGGAKEMIKDKETGILIPAENISENLVKSFILLRSDPELKKKIETNALNLVKNNFTWEKQNEKLNSFLREVYDKYYRK